MLKLGLDEAGRGPVIGPLVLAGCLLNQESEKELKKIGVKDSKLLSSKKREELFEKIRELAEDFEIMIVYPKEIDGHNSDGIKLNELEALAFAKIINKINKGFGKIKIVADCPSKNPRAWREFLQSKIESTSNLNISCEYKADQNHVAVSAASILAKTIREKEMFLLREEYGEIGSGYCHDPKTIKFLKENVKKYDKDGIFRKTWSTWKNAIENLSQKVLEGF